MEASQSNIQDIYPLAPLQEGILFHSLNDEGMYFQQMYYSLTGSLDVQIFRQVFEELVERHDVLRTAFLFNVEEEPLQVVLKRRSLDFYFSDLSTLESQKLKDSRVEEFLKSDRKRSFNLEKDPLLRVSLLRLERNKYMIIWSYNHIIVDGWSVSILNDEFWSLYRDLLTTANSKFVVASSYGDFIDWIGNQDGSLAEKYWNNYLKNGNFDSIIGPEVIDATNIDDPKTDINKESTVFLKLSNELSSILIDTSRRYGITLNILLSTIWSFLNSINNDRDDITIGSVVSGRGIDIQGIEHIVGLFVNTIPFRTIFNDNKLFIDILRTSQSNYFESNSYHHYPLTKIHSDLKRKNIFNQIWSFENYPSGNQKLIDDLGLAISDFRIIEKTNYDLNITGRQDNGINFTVLFNPDKFSSNLINSLCETYQILVELCVTNLDKLVVDIKSEFSKIIYNRTYSLTKADVTYPNCSVSDLFNEITKKYPNNIAVSFKEKSLTYADLDSQSSKLAEILKRDYKIKPNCFVGILMERSDFLLVCILGVIKAGACYVPFDPNFPSTRIDGMLEDCKPSLVICSDSFRSKYEDIVRESHIKNLINDCVYDYFPNKISLDSLLYVIYTSGSTGRPKGVKVTHRNLIQLIYNDKSEFEFNEKDVWTLFHSHAFDFSVWEIFGALLFGARLEVVPYEITMDPRSFYRLILDRNVTILNVIPTIFTLISEEALRSVNLESSLRYIIFGGEKLVPSSLYKWYISFPYIKLINMYGITETTVHVSYKELTWKDIACPISNIGRPLPPLDVYILNQRCQALPSYCIGEIAVAGDGLSMGYLNNDFLTQQKFIKNPYDENEKIYLSGDLGYRISSGEIVYMGRKDQQVKVNGYRIELGDIEYWVIKYPNIINACVIKHTGDFIGDDMLICYFEAVQTIELVDLRNFLKSFLPEFMIPSLMIEIDEFPRTNSGKIDRGKLPKYSANSLNKLTLKGDETEHLENKILPIVKKVLNNPSILLESDFFLSGGDSIKAIRLISALKNDLDIDIKIKDIYEYPILNDFCKYIEQFSIEGTYENLKRVALNNWKELEYKILSETENRKFLPIDWESFFPISDIIQGMIFHSLNSPKGGIYLDRIYFEFSEIDEFNSIAFTRAMKLICDKHSILRSSFNFDDFMIPLHVIHEASSFIPQLRFYDLTNMFDKIVQDDFINSHMKELLVSDNLNNIELWRMDIFNLDKNRTGVLLFCHHAILDGWSVASLFSELSNIYIACKNSPVPSLEVLSSSYKDYVIDELVTKSDNSVKQFWKNELLGFQKTNLPLRKIIPSNSEINEKMIYSSVIPRVVLEKVEKYSNDESISIKNILFSVFLFLVQSTVGEKDICVGLVSSSRPETIGGDQILGCFLNTVPFRFNFTERRLKNKAFVDIVDQLLKKMRGKEKLSLLEITKFLEEDRINENHYFDVIFNFVDFHIFDNVNRQIKFEQSQVKNIVNTNSHFDFTIEKDKDAYLISVNFNANVFTIDEIKKLVDFYNDTLNYLTACPEDELVSFVSAIELEGGAENNKMIGPKIDQGNKEVSVRSAISDFQNLSREVISIWKRILNVDDIDLDVSFFDIGGTSVKLIKLHSLLFRELGVEMQISDLFKYYTVRQLCEYVSNNSPDKHDIISGYDV